VLLVVRDHTVLQRYTYTAAVSGLVLLLLPALPVLGQTINGARLWIRVGPFTFQPSEVAKLLLVLFFAGYLVAKRDVLSLASRRVLGLDLPRARDLGPVLVAWAASLAVLVRGRDLGSSLLFFALFVVMLYIATERTSWLVIGVGLFLGGAYVAHGIFSHVQRRVSIWLDPFEDADGAGFQLVQSLFGFGTGGLTGTGLGEGTPELGAVREHRLHHGRDRLRSSGSPGSWPCCSSSGSSSSGGLRTALSVRDSFGKLLAAGLSFSLCLQVFVIVGGVTGLIPLTGRHAAVAVLRRVVHRGQLGARRGPAQDQRRRTPSGRLPGHARRRPGRARVRADAGGPAPAATGARTGTGSRRGGLVNRPLRRVAARLHGAVRLLMLNANWVQVVQGRRLPRRPPQQPVLLRTYERERGAIAVVQPDGSGRTAVAESTRTDGPLTVAAQYPGGPAVRPLPPGYYSARLRPHRGSSAARTRCCPARDDRFFVRRSPTRSPDASRRAATSSRRSTRRAGGGLRRLGDNRGAGRRARPAHRRGARHGEQAVVRPDAPVVVRAGRHPRLLRAARTRTRPTRCSTARSAAPTRRARPSRSSPRRRRCPPATSRPRPRSRRRASSTSRRRRRRCATSAGSSCGGETITLPEAMRISCNTAFGSLGLSLGADRIREQAAGVRLRRRLAAGADDRGDQRLPEDPNEPQTAQSAIGQFDVRATPLQMAMVAAVSPTTARSWSPTWCARCRRPTCRGSTRPTRRCSSGPSTRTSPRSSPR
jgi:hypothetical protein